MNINMKDKESSNTDNSDSLEFIKIQYQILANKQLNHDSLVWNSPSLLFVAQALFFELSLSDELSILIRLCISFVCILTSIFSLQIFLRSRLMEIADAEQLYSIEKLMIEKGNTYVLSIHNKLEKRTIIINGNYYNLMEFLENNSFYKKKGLSNISTFNLWKYLFYIDIILAIIIFIYNLISNIDIILTVIIYL